MVVESRGFANSNIRHILSLLVVAFLLQTLGTTPASARGSADRRNQNQNQAGSFDLLIYLRRNVVAPVDPLNTKIPRYNRKKHFGGWVYQNPAQPCRDTRALVLIRDADRKARIGFKPGDCAVDTALWHDPYTGRDFTDSTDIDIDHVVALGNAYYAGAHAWRPARRCHYANFMQNNIHLKSVNDHENRLKNAYGPEDYLPPARSYRCRYVGDWMRIKTIWQLSITRDELTAIENVIRQERCGRETTHANTLWLSDQRAKSTRPIKECVLFEIENRLSSPSHGSIQEPILDQAS